MMSVISPGFSPTAAKRLGRSYEVDDLPASEEALMVKFRIQQDIPAVTTHKPDRHCGSCFALGGRAFHEHRDGKAGKRGIAEGIDLILRRVAGLLRLVDAFTKSERGDRQYKAKPQVVHH
jgi:hypothetical protein